jgi:hypothetical protein
MGLTCITNLKGHFRQEREKRGAKEQTIRGKCMQGHFFVWSSRELPYVLFKLHYMQIVYNSLISLPRVLFGAKDTHYKARAERERDEKINGSVRVFNPAIDLVNYLCAHSLSVRINN